LGTSKGEERMPMTRPDGQTEQTRFATLDRVEIVQDVRARLSAVSNDLSDSQIGVEQLRKDAEELTAVVSRMEWLADVSERFSGPH
jgi:hypothetical protein